MTSVQPGRFRTEVQAVAHYAEPIADYAPTAGTLGRRFATTSGTQPGDPRKAMPAVIDLVDMPAAPLRLPLGSDAIERIRAKLEAAAADLDRAAPIAAACAFDE